ncbi:hypothetical protein N7493_011297 [Penicillium malachiteum]|uniref:P-loop containing nucleoside triphosphate hydrolase protein n=1 Tax=Penicillium malachiteum TaxID=1324776 RepID=A0AAD6HBZ2_9EURO|nr:hypothetical protein N7493_011297 [Penicillium malachiteum]
MSTKPIYVAAHPRACSTAFERVFMTQRATIQCVHEPFGDAWYYGPERLADRFEDDEQGRLDSGFSNSTYRTVMDRLEREGSEGKRVFIKDIDAYLLPPGGKPASIAPSLRRIKRGVGTTSSEDDHHPANGVHANGHTTATNSTTNGAVSNGVYTNGASQNGHVETNGHINGHTNGHSNGVNGHANGCNGHAHTNGTSKSTPYPYDTPKETGNPTVMPRELQEKFHWAFLIRDPHHSIPSYYRCTIPPLDTLTGFHNFDPKEAGYSELRRHFDYLHREGLVGPRVATRPDLSPEVGSEADRETVHEVCVVDADDMLDAPAPMIEAFCRSTGVPYTPDMLEWDTDEDYAFACEAFEKWRGFHNDAIESKGLTARAHKHAPKTEEQWDADWVERYGPQGAALIRQTVNETMDDYLYLKQFAMKV